MKKITFFVYLYHQIKHLEEHLKSHSDTIKRLEEHQENLKTVSHYMKTEMVENEIKLYGIVSYTNRFVA